MMGKKKVFRFRRPYICGAYVLELKDEDVEEYIYINTSIEEKETGENTS